MHGKCVPTHLSRHVSTKALWDMEQTASIDVASAKFGGGGNAARREAREFACR